VGIESGMLLVMLGCNNGGGGGNFSKVKRLVRKGVGTPKRSFSGFSCFLHQMCGIFEKQELFPRTCLTHKTTYAYLSCSWAGGISMKIWIQTYFGPVTVDSVEVFRHFAFWRHGTRLPTFFIAPTNCIF